jgi:hypothetical protein
MSFLDEIKKRKKEAETVTTETHNRLDPSTPLFTTNIYGVGQNKYGRLAQGR